MSLTPLPFKASDLPALTHCTPPGAQQPPVHGDPQALVPEINKAVEFQRRKAMQRQQRDQITRMVDARANRGGLMALFRPNPGALVIGKGRK